MGARIRPVEMLTPDRYVRSYTGVVVQVNGQFMVNVMGNNVSARWADPLAPQAGDTVIVQFTAGRTQGLGTCTVVSRISGRARPQRGTVAVVPPSSDTVTVTGLDGFTYYATFVTSYTPVVGDQVFLSWSSSRPTIIGKIAATAAPPTPIPPAAPVAPPPAPPQTGTSAFWATDSNTFWAPGGWGSWAGGRGRVYQGNYGSGDVFGAYFYNGGPTQMQGRSISQLRIAFGNRAAVGSYNSPVTIHIYATTNATRPSGIITTAGGPIDVTAWPGQGLTEYNITPLAGAIQAGGGIAIFGSGYAGFLGIPEQPDSGRLTFDWSM